MTEIDDLKRIGADRRKPDLLDLACDRQTLMYALGIFAAIACLTFVLIWR